MAKWKKASAPETTSQAAPDTVVVEPQPQPAIIDVKLYEEALEAQQADLVALRRYRAELLRGVINDPVNATVKINETDASIRDALIRIEALNAALSEAEAAALIQREQAAIAASAANRAAGLHRARTAIVLAAQVDAAANALLVSIRTLRLNGVACEKHLQDALAEMYGSNSVRMFDALITVAPRSTSTGSDIAVALANTFKKILDELGSRPLDNWVAINGFVPKAPQTLEQAATLDAKFLIERFA